MLPTPPSSPLAERKARSATLRTKSLLEGSQDGAGQAPALRLTGNRREGYATGPLRLKREPSRLLAQTAQDHDVHPAAALEVAGMHDALLREPEALRKGA